MFFLSFYVVAATQLIIDKLRNKFLSPFPEHSRLTHLIGRRIKNPKKSAINNHILPEGQGTMMISLFFKVEQMFSNYFRKNPF